MNEKVVLVTGATGGIGLSITNVLSSEGWRTLTNSRSVIALPKAIIASEHKVFDCTNLKEVNKSLLELRDQQIFLSDLVCCVGSGRINIGPNENSWIKYFQVNLLSCTTVVESALEIFKDSLRNVVIVSSIVGSKAMVDPPTEYSVAKAALNQYVRVKALQIAKDGRTINAISPGNIMFPGSPWEHRLNFDKEDTLHYISKNVPLDKFGSSSDISSLLPFLLRRESFTTGQIFHIDGGQSL